LCREVCEELGNEAKVLAENAVEIPEKYIVKIRDVVYRRARNEEWTFFVAKVPADIELGWCEHEHKGCSIKWLDIDALIDEKVVRLDDVREYNARVLIPAIKNL